VPPFAGAFINLLLEQFVTLFMGSLTSFAQLIVMLFKASPNRFVIASALEFFDFFLASFPINFGVGKGGCGCHCE
jgi:hypothetical protein